MKKFYTLLAALMMVFSAANAQSSDVPVKRVTSLGSALQEVSAIPTDGTPVIIYMRGDNDNKGGYYPISNEYNRMLYITCSTTGADQRIGFIHENPTTVADASNLLFNFELVEGTTDQYYIKAPNGEYLTSALTVANQNADGAVTTSATNKAKFTISSDGTNSKFKFKRADITSNLYLNIQSNAYDGGYINYWGGSGGWSQWDIYVPTVADEQTTMYTVNWTMQNENGDQLTTGTAEVAADGGSFSLPAYPYTTYTSSDANVSIANNIVTLSEATEGLNITITATFNTPFEASTSYDAAHWYYVQNKSGNGYIMYAGESADSIPIVAELVNADAYKWAFIGDPVHGYSIINKAAPNKYLRQEGSSNGSTDAAITYPSIGDEEYTWTLLKVREHDSSISNDNWITFKASDGNNYWNNRRYKGAQGTAVLSYWTGFGNGSSWEVVDVPSPYATLETTLASAQQYELGSELNQYTDPNGNLDAAITTAKALTEESDETAITAATTALIDGMNALTLNMPERGTYLRLKGYSSNGYLTSPEAGSSSNITTSTTGADAVTSIWYYGEDGLLSYYSGQYLGTQKVLSAGAVSATIVANTNYLGTYAVRTNNNRYLYSANGDGDIDRGDGEVSGLTQQGYAWTLEKVASLPVTLHQSGESYYGTLCLPKATYVMPVDNVEAYKVTKAQDGSAHLETLPKSETIPGLSLTVIAAQEPVVLVGTAESVNVRIDNNASTATKSTDNLLTGVLFATQLSADNFYFGQYNGTPGFYQTTSTKYITNKAYLAASAVTTPSTEAKGFALDFGTVTGIEQLVNNAEVIDANAPRYNLAGQRVTNAYKGVVVVNGKKQLVK